MIDYLNDPYAVAAQEDRSAPRTKLSIPAQLRPSGSKGVKTVVHDLSLSGFSCMAVNRLAPGTMVWLTLPGLEALQADVVWWEYSRVGCAFRSMLSPFVHENLLTRWAGDGVYRMI